MKKSALIVLVIQFLALSLANAQFKDLDKRIGRKVQQRVDRKIDRTIDKGLDEVEKGADDATKPDGSKEEGTAPKENAGEKPAAGTSSGGTTNSTGSDFKSYSKFDFIPGEKVIVFEDFSQDAIGDFPAKWNTNASAEIVTIENYEGHWLALTTSGIVTPEFITDLPENFTLEFDLMVTPGYSYYDSPFLIHLVEAENKNDIMNWHRFRASRSGVEVSLHPQDAGSSPRGQSEYTVFLKGTKSMGNNVGQLTCFNNADKTHARISIWRQNQRLRLYVNETKLWDLPRAFDKETKYNTVVFQKDNAKNDNNYFIKDIRLAVGKPDTRSKLITEGKFSTTGIYFNTNSANIKPESYGVIKEIADVLKENSTVNILIVGHTDADGDDKYNLDLSKKRAESVKQNLVKEFGIAESRIKTDGKGEAVPVSDNNTTAGKAANRRVDFIKQ